jgi:hypothetical protein
MQTHGRQTAGSPHILTSFSVLRAFQGSLRRVTVLPKGGESACSFRRGVLAAQTFRSRRLKMLCEIAAVEQHDLHRIDTRQMGFDCLLQKSKCET